MDYTRDLVALSTGDHKMAALFFDSIWPLHSQDDVPDEVQAKSLVEFADKEGLSAIEELCKSRPDEPSGYAVTGSPIASKLLKEVISLLDFRNKQQYRFQNKWVYPMQVARDAAAKILTEILERKGVTAMPVFSSEIMMLTLLAEGKQEALEVTLGNLPLVDTERVAWEQIIELRNDADAKRRFRNLRLFAHKNYEGKSPSFIRDDIEKQLEEYEQSCHTHGFDLIISSAKLVLDAKSTLSMASIGLIAALSGSSVATSIAAIGGITVETGRILLNIMEKRYAFRSVTRNHELAYLFDVKSKLHP